MQLTGTQIPRRQRDVECDKEVKGHHRDKLQRYIKK